MSSAEEVTRDPDPSVTAERGAEPIPTAPLDERAKHGEIPASVPGSYWGWLVAIGVSLLGGQVQSFALGWTATAHGAASAALVLTASSVPRTVLLLIGGAVADHRGPWLVMVISDAVMCAATVALAVAVVMIGSPAWLLLTAAAVTGVSGAFYSPASSTIPRRLVEGPALGRAMAGWQVAGQAVTILGPPLGGLVIVSLGLGGAAALNAVSFAVILCLLLTVRTRFTVADPPAAANSGRLFTRAFDGVRIVARDRLLRSLLALVALVAGCALPIGSLLIPLLVRSHHWPASTAGAMVGAQALGAGAIILVVLVRDTNRRPGVAAAIGLFTIAAATVLLAAVGSPDIAPIISAAAGLGFGLFGVHVSPLILAATPSQHMSRVQAVVALCQSLPLIIGLAIAGALTSQFGVRWMLFLTGLALFSSGILALRSSSIRNAQLSTRA